MGNKLKKENYIVIPAWATQEPYNLKGNELIIYSIIYGFSQLKDQCFCGSIAYLTSWTSATRQGVMKNLNNLVNRGLIRKVESFPTNRYYINHMNKVADIPDVNIDDNDVNSVTEDVNNVSNDTELSLDNNINNNITNIINNKYEENRQLSLSINEIITYLNNICGTKFKSNTAATKKLIKSRIKEGFTFEDFKKVIDVKYEDWGKNPVKFNNGQLSNEYLRPSTLFGDNFENYLNEASKKKDNKIPFTSKSIAASDERSELTF